MRKIFLFVAAMFMALTASAAVIQINTSTTDALRKALNGAQTGDIIEMAAGTYVESPEDYIAFTGKNVTVRAAEGAEVIVQPNVPVRLKSGARAEFIGIKFDCGHLSDVNPYSHMFLPADNSDGKKFIMTNCEFYNWTQNNSLFQTPSDRKLDSLVINNCYFHDCVKSVIHFTNVNLVGVEIKNSTFANIADPTNGTYWSAPIHVAATSGTVLVDHCTFYDVKPISLSYGAITTTTATVVSNCIMVLSESIDMCATNLPEGSEVKNTLTFNYANWQEYGHYNTATKTDCVWGDPLFVYADAKNFQLEANSPALGVGTDGSNLGAPRWGVAAPAEYKTIYCKVEADWWNYDYDNRTAVCAYAWGGITQPAWPGILMTKVEGEEYIWKAEIDTRYTNILFTRCSADKEYKGVKTADLTIPTNDNNMYTITKATRDWSSDPEAMGEEDGEWGKYAPYVQVLEDGFYLIGKFGGVDAWTVADLTAAKKFEWNKNVGEGNEEWKVVADLAEGDKVKACYVYHDAITSYTPDGEGNEYVVDANHAGSGKTIYFQQLYNNEWGGHFWIDANEGTGLNNLNAVKVVKMIENGQLVIIKNGVRYNAQGAIMK